MHIPVIVHSAQQCNFKFLHTASFRKSIFLILLFLLLILKKEFNLAFFSYALCSYFFPCIRNCKKKCSYSSLYPPPPHCSLFFLSFSLFSLFLLFFPFASHSNCPALSYRVSSFLCAELTHYAFHLHSFLKKLNFNWLIVDLWCFRYIAKWFIYIYVYSFSYYFPL